MAAWLIGRFNSERTTSDKEVIDRQSSYRPVIHVKKRALCVAIRKVSKLDDSGSSLVVRFRIRCAF